MQYLLGCLFPWFDDGSWRGKLFQSFIEHLPGDPDWCEDHGGTLHPRHAVGVVALVVEEDHVLQACSSLLCYLTHVIIFARCLIDFCHILLQS